MELKDKIFNSKIFEKTKILYLPDEKFNIEKFKKQIKTNNKIENIFNNNNIIFLAAGRLTKQKNFTYLIEEFSKFYFEKNNCNLIILGDGEYFKKLKDLIKKKKLQKAIHLMGKVDNIFSYMKDSHAFILSSKWEEMGFVLLKLLIKFIYNL